MKKLKKFLRFSFISALVFVVFLFIFRFLFNLIWNFDILSWEPYQKIIDFWNKGGVFNKTKDCTLLAGLVLMPIIWLLASYKLYKYGLKKFLTTPIIKTYRRLTRPKSMEVEHVTIKNLGVKDKSLDEIIADKIKEQGEKTGSGNMSKNLRQQISAKIEENEKQ